MKKRIAALCIALAMLFSLASCVEVTYQPAPQTPSAPAAPQAPAQTQPQAPSQPHSTVDSDYTWAIYWYLCGSDLESNGACATRDLQELLSVQLPDDVVFVIETGGAKKWNNNLMTSGKLQRWLYSSEGLQAIGEEPRANMGESETLYDFLEFAKTNYPAEKTGLLFWNHGGGSVAGAAFDEIYSYDSLNLNEMYAACGAALGANADEPPLEFVGFDTCLMATIDVAATFSDLAHYMVASEEVEPGNGWLYSGWVQALANDPSMNGAKLGKYICDSFAQGCRADRTADGITLSVTDLSKLDPLLDAYEAFGAEALISAKTNNRIITKLGKAASVSENYGGNTKSQGYTNMVDLGSFAANCSEFLDSAADVQQALENCVVYKISGRYKANSEGLSCYYSYNNDRRDYTNYAALTKDQPYKAFSYLYDWQINGKPSKAAYDYIDLLQSQGGKPNTDKPTQPQPQDSLRTIYDMGWDKGVKVSLDKKTGNSYIKLGKEADDILTSVCFELFYEDPSGMQILMGFDNDITADWTNGIFTDNFRGVWGAIDGTPVYMELCYGTPEYSLYSVPVLLNEEKYNLQVVYSFETEEWQVLGARKGLEPENGMSAKELRPLEKGDVISVIWKIGTNAYDDDLQNYAVAEIEVDETTSFGEADLFDGTYKYVFEMTDAQGNVGLSAPVTFKLKNGEITTTVGK